MHPKLIAELNKSQLDYSAISRFITLGVPIKTFGIFNTGRFEPVGILDTDNGKNIFHHLSGNSQLLCNILQNILSPDSGILTREGKTIDDLFNLILQQNLDNLNHDELRLILKYAGVAKPFLTNVIKNGRDDVMQKVCSTLGYRDLQPYFEDIVTIAKNLKSAESSRAFGVLFNQYPMEVILSIDNNASAVGDSLSVAQLIIRINLAITAQKELPEQLLENLLTICLNRFKEGTLSVITFAEVQASEILTDPQKEVLQAFVTKLGDPLGSSAQTSDSAAAAASEVVTLTEAAEGVATPILLGVDRASAVESVTATASAAVEEGVVSAGGSDMIVSYVAQVQSILSDKDYNDRFIKYLGKDYSQLHSYIYLCSLGEKYFQKVLEKAAKKLGVVAMAANDFLAEYISKLDSSELLKINSKLKLNARDLTYKYNLPEVTKLLLSQGYKLEIYSYEGMLDDAFKQNFVPIVKYLLNEYHEGVIGSWFDILAKAMRYHNDAGLEVINCYLSSDTVVRDVKPGKEGKLEYSVLNKGLNYLASSCYAFLRSEEQLEKKESQEKVRLPDGDREAHIVKIRTEAKKEITFFSSAIKIMIDGGKVFYAENDYIICAKTFSLLKKLIKFTSKVTPEELDLSDINAIRDSIITTFKEFKSGGQAFKSGGVDFSKQVDRVISDLEFKISHPHDAMSMASGMTDQTRASIDLESILNYGEEDGRVGADSAVAMSGDGSPIAARVDEDAEY